MLPEAGYPVLRDNIRILGSFLQRTISALGIAGTRWPYVYTFVSKTASIWSYRFVVRAAYSEGGRGAMVAWPLPPEIKREEEHWEKSGKRRKIGKQKIIRCDLFSDFLLLQRSQTLLLGDGLLTRTFSPNSTLVFLVISFWSSKATFGGPGITEMPNSVGLNFV